MLSNFKSIEICEDLCYSTDTDYHPLEFFLSVVPISKNIDFKLGYFSSTAIKELSACFAEFIFNNPKSRIRLITNHFLDDIDITLVFGDDKNVDSSEIENWIENDYKKLLDSLSKRDQHFFNCIRYLMNEKRIQIIPVISKGLVHFKEAIYEDYEGNKIYTNGSCNFSKSGLVINEESFDLVCSWQSSQNEKKIINKKKKYDLIFNKKNKRYHYVSSKNQIEKLIEKKVPLKSIEDIIRDDITLNQTESTYPKRLLEVIKIVSQRKVINAAKAKKEILKNPRFPYPSPYPYQEDAYKSWKKNEKFKGLFSMATGTGKTLTSLYCLIEEYKKSKVQKNIFVVPTKELVHQWSEEIKSCNFSPPKLWFGSYNKLKKTIQDIKILKKSGPLNIVVSYDSFKSDHFQKVFRNSFKDFTVVFDEVHNLGAHGVRSALKDVAFGRTIGLSATPLRLWDDDGENEFIEKMFDSYHPDYTFSFPMKDAIGKFLVPYNYYPKFSYLEDEEWESYMSLTKQISYGGEEGKINTKAALRRQLLLDQTAGKHKVLIEIIDELIKKNKFKRTLVYCPKGKIDNNDEEKIIEELQELVCKKFSNLNIQLFVGDTKGRDLLLNDFQTDLVHMLFSIKVLDEGVNVPMAENAIFIASGKNYREFVQRRGRVLRKFKDSTTGYEKTHANIYDIIVLPTTDHFEQNKVTAKKLIISEFKRFLEFNHMAIENNEIFHQIDGELKKYDLSIYYIEELIQNEQRDNFKRNS